jgi:hypothetical protein
VDCYIKDLNDLEKEEYQHRILVSVELLTQILLHKNTKSTLTDDIVHQKMEYTASSLNSVNLDRYQALGEFQNIGDNTVTLAFALHRKMRFETRHLVKAPRGMVLP